MDLLEAILLGIIQGATEFLPISSSGHLVLIPWWLGLQEPPILFIVVVHLATTIAVLSYFWHDWVTLLQASTTALRERNFDIQDDPQLRLLFFMGIGTIPAGVVGLLLADYFDAIFSTPTLVSFNLLITAALLSYSQWISDHRAHHSTSDPPSDTVSGVLPRYKILETMQLSDAVFIGIAQAIAILPGISRSGSTISAGLFRGLDRATAARYSFLLSTPIILAAGLKQSLDLIGGEASLDSVGLASLAGGFFAALVIGYLSIAFLLRVIRQYGLYSFAFYCVAFGLVSLGAAILRG